MDFETREGFKKCMNFAIESHKGQNRKHGAPYVTHPIIVSIVLRKKGFSKAHQVTGLFHDIIEETSENEREKVESKILELSSPEILNSVKLLTKNKGYDMETYIEGIKSNEMAKMVKLADKLHNLIDVRTTTVEFKQKTLKEAEKWYIDLAKGTEFEEEINLAIKQLKENIQELDEQSR